MKLIIGNSRAFNEKLATAFMVIVGVTTAIAFTYWLYALTF